MKKPDPDCKHEAFEAFVDVNRLTPTEYMNAPVKNFLAEIRIQCAQCHGEFMFTDLPVAISTRRPCLNISRTQASLPIKPWDGMLAAGTIPVEMPK